MEDCWQELFSTSHRDDARLFTCMRAWRCAVLKRKHRFQVVTAREWRQVHFFQVLSRELPLHAVVTSLDHHGEDMSDVPFELVTYVSAVFPGCAELLDECHRAPLFYALEQQWQLEKLSWLVDRTLPVILEKDSEGLSMIVSAVVNKCPEEMIVWMAVAVAQTCLESSQQLLDGRHCESARRYCHRMLQDYFSGVPEFPLACCREILIHNQQQEDVLAAVNGIRVIWQEFVHKWGYYGAPIILKDLPPVLRAPVDSFAQVSVVAKGEPLSYQWFNDDAPINGATQSFLYISQSIQAHNAGSYYCEISNWKGTVTTVVMEAEVVDDQFDVDPALKYQIPRELLHHDDIVCKVRASTGAFLHHHDTGVRLLLPPHCFKCLDSHGNDVSDSLGLEVLIRTFTSEDKLWGLKLRRGETLVSCIIEILPYSAPTFLRPLALLIPHSISSLDQHNQLVVVKVDHVTGKHQDVPSSSCSGSSTQQKQMVIGSQTSVEISTFGTFAVISRSLPSSLEVEHPLEQVKLYFVRPKCITTAAYHRKVVASLWISRDRHDNIQHANVQIQDHLDNIRSLSSDASQQQQWTVDTFAVGIRRGNLLFIQFGEKERIVYQWGAQEEKKKDNQSSLGALESPANRQHHCCIEAQVELQPSEIMETASTPEEPLPPFCAVKIDIAVRKPSSYSLKGKSKVDTSFSVLLSETLWQVLIPVANDTPRVPPKPQLMQRTPTQVVLEFDFSKAPAVESNNSIKSAGSRRSTFKGASSRLVDNGRRELQGTATEDPDDAKPEDRFEEIHEGEREFTPYFYIVEMAKFSDTFWQRYDQTWWFDKTKTKIIDGMYKVAHLGFEPFAKIMTDTYAGCFRVAQCSLDNVGAYSEPFLLDPLVAESESGETLRVEVESNSSARSTGLVRKLRSLQSSSSPRTSGTGAVCEDCSAAMAESKARLQHLLTTTYATFDHFEALFGFPNDGIDSVMKSLETLKMKNRASNRELALLLLALHRLKVCGRKVYMRKRWIANWIQKMLLLERLAPELDCYPVEFFSKVTAKLHQLVVNLFMIVMKLLSNGWLRHLLLNEWLETELRSIVERTIVVLTNDGKSLRGAKEIVQELHTFLDSQDKDDGSGSDKLERMVTDKMQIFALQLLGKCQNESKETKLLIAEQLVHAFELMSQPIKRAGDNEETEIIDVQDQVIAELGAELELSSTQNALEKLRQEDSLEKHIRLMTPANGELCQQIPTRIAIHLDPLVTNINTQQQVLKVTNITTSSATVHGTVAFSSSDGLLTFTPTVAFERKTKYTVKVRCEEIQTCLGVSLRGFVTFHFRTT